MKITELIERLQEIRNNHGDVFVNALTGESDLSKRTAFGIDSAIVDDEDAFLMIVPFPEPCERVEDYLRRRELARDAADDELHTYITHHELPNGDAEGHITIRKSRT